MLWFALANDRQPAMNTKTLLAAFLMIAPVSGFADSLIVTLPEHCDAGEDAVLDNGGYVLHDDHVEALEYFCEFEPLPPRFWEDDKVDIRPGYCRFDTYFGTEVFAFTQSHSTPGEIWMFGENGREDMFIFHVCDLQQN